MPTKQAANHFPYILMIGAVWGFTEAALGAGLRTCASFVSGSIMTAAALFFIATAWVLTRRVITLVLVVAVVSLMKMFDAVLLSLPFKHGAVANPIFAFWTEVGAFLMIIAVMKTAFSQRRTGQAVLGGLAALLAVNMFPLVKYATGIPACVVPGTSYPLSLYYAPLSIGLSLFTVPLGFWAGEKLLNAALKHEALVRARAFRYVASPATLIICLLIIVILRLAK
ncbi:MAG: hypothetical protein QHH14_07605 [Clostridiales bacterium]|nr:hypothetical protein [Clostridiales bacterium]